MFLKRSLDVPNIATLREHSANIPGILRAGWAENVTRNLLNSSLNSSFKFQILHQIIQWRQDKRY